MGYVYKYTHVTTGKWYIGSHNGNKKNYIGSGLLFTRAVKKYGIDSFAREILYDGDEYRSAEESILIELDAANDPLSYNMKNQALGGTFFGKKNGMFQKTHSADSRYNCGSAFRGKLRPDHSVAVTGTNNGRYKDGTRSKSYHENIKTLRLKLGVKHLLKRVECPHCGLSGSGPNMTRYHFDKCKQKC